MCVYQNVTGIKISDREIQVAANPFLRLQPHRHRFQVIPLAGEVGLSTFFTYKMYHIITNEPERFMTRARNQLLILQRQWLAAVLRPKNVTVEVDRTFIIIRNNVVASNVRVANLLVNERKLAIVPFLVLSLREEGGG